MFSFSLVFRRALPDQPLDREYPRDAWMNGGEGANTAVPSQGDGNGPMVEKSEGAADADTAGVDGVKKEEAMGDYVVSIIPRVWMLGDLDVNRRM